MQWPKPAYSISRRRIMARQRGEELQQGRRSMSSSAVTSATEQRCASGAGSRSRAHAKLSPWRLPTLRGTTTFVSARRMRSDIDVHMHGQQHIYEYWGIAADVHKFSSRPIPLYRLDRPQGLVARRRLRLDLELRYHSYTVALQLRMRSARIRPTAACACCQLRYAVEIGTQPSIRSSSP